VVWSFILLLPADIAEVGVFVAAVGLGCWLVVVFSTSCFGGLVFFSCLVVLVVWMFVNFFFGYFLF
jgi:hypothetical protein